MTSEDAKEHSESRKVIKHNGKGTMPLFVNMSANDIVTIDGIRIQVMSAVKLAILDRATVVFPNKQPKVKSEPKSKESKT